LKLLPGVEAVKVRVGGEVRQELYPGVDLRRPVTAADARRPKGKPAVAELFAAYDRRLSSRRAGCGAALLRAARLSF